MLRKLRSRLTYANVVATMALFVALGGTAYAVNTVGSTDIIDGQVKSVDIGDNEIGSSDVKDNSLNTFDVHSFLGVDVVDGTLTGADVENGSLDALDVATDGLSGTQINESLDDNEILNGGLNDEDVGQVAVTDFVGSIGVVPAASCVYRDLQGVSGSGGDHVVLTANNTDAAGGLIYSAEYLPTGHTTVRMKVCNPFAAAIDDGNTHFNLLTIDAQSF